MRMGNEYLARCGSALAGWSERWMPDAFVFALLAVIIVFIGGLAFGCPAGDLVQYFGEGFWSLIPFTMQMVMIGGLDVDVRTVSWLPLYHDMGLMMVMFTAFFGAQVTLMDPMAFLRRPYRWIKQLGIDPEKANPMIS